MNRAGFWGYVVRTHAALGLSLSPIFAFGSWFVAKSNFEIAFAFSQLFLVVPFWRMLHYRHWAGLFVCCIHLASLGFTLFHWEEFDFLPFKIAETAAVLSALLALTLGKRLWRKGF